MLRQIYPALTPAAAQVRAEQLTSTWYRSFLMFNPQTELAEGACPTLLLHGTANTQVPLAANLPALERGLKASKRVLVQKLDGLNHGFQAPLDEQALTANTAVHPIAATDALETVGGWVMQQVK